MSMIGLSAFIDVIGKQSDYDDLAQVLTTVNGTIRKALNQEADGGNTDGMDVLLWSWTTRNQEVHLNMASAHRPLLYDMGEGIVKVKGTNQSIGGGGKALNRPFENQKLVLPIGTKIYLTSDGYVDQVGENKRKIGSNQLFSLLSECFMKDGEATKLHLEEFLANHQGAEKQRDDITVIGIQL